MFRIFKRRDEVFHRLIEQQAAVTLEGIRLLCKYVEHQDPQVAEELSLKEKEADEVRRILIDELNRTFVTPFDREDIFTLSRTIDDVLDYAYSTVSEMEVLKVESTPYLVRIASLLKDAAYEIHQAVQRRGVAVIPRGEHAGEILMTWFRHVGGMLPKPLRINHSCAVSRNSK